jgi:hypothetical protein
MNFTHSGHKDSLWFVVALVVPAIVGGARFVQTEREMDRIAQAQVERAMVGHSGQMQPALRLASADRRGR